MIYIKNLSFSYGGNIIFSDLNLNIYRKDRIGLIGVNGSGKTTFLKILTGELKPESGEINLEGNIRIGYIPQELIFEDDETPLTLGRKAFEEENSLIKKFEYISHKLEKDFNNEKLIHEYDNILQKLNELDAFNIDYKIKKVYFNLGFDEESINKKLKICSGGFKVRAYIGYLLLLKKDLLLLDEPTNYLDIDSIIFLTEYLKSYNKAFILISHDVNFLDNLINKVFYINNKKIYEFNNCNYSEFISKKEEMIDRINKINENKIKEIEHLQEFVDRFRAKNTLATRVQSKIKKIEKLQDEIVDLKFEDKKINFFINSNKNRFSNILSFENVYFKYSNSSNNNRSNYAISTDENFVLENISFSITRGDKILLVGRNGIGKTTLLKLASKALAPTSGNITYHNNATWGYFSQDLSETMDFDNTVIEEFEKERVVNKFNDTEKRTYLGVFGFEKDDIFKKVKNLSGGEKVRLLISKIFVNAPDILILDEPTTYLDIFSKDVLAKCIKEFEGAVLLVSHDIDFIKKVSNIIWTIENKSLKKLNSFEEYLNLKKEKGNEYIQELKSNKENLKNNLKNKDFKNIKELKETKNNNKNRKDNNSNINNNIKIIKEKEKKKELIHQKITQIENRIKEIENIFAEGKWDNSFVLLKKEYDDLKIELENLEREWIEL